MMHERGLTLTSRPGSSLSSSKPPGPPDFLQPLSCCSGRADCGSEAVKPSTSTPFSFWLCIKRLPALTHVPTKTSTRFRTGLVLGSGLCPLASCVELVGLFKSLSRVFEWCLKIPGFQKF